MLSLCIPVHSLKFLISTKSKLCPVSFQSGAFFPLKFSLLPVTMLGMSILLLFIYDTWFKECFVLSLCILIHNLKCLICTKPELCSISFPFYSSKFSLLLVTMVGMSIFSCFLLFFIDI